MFVRDPSGRILPIRFKPKEDELLSSWVCRLALAHGLKATSFCSRVIPQRSGKRAIQLHDMDGGASQEALIGLAEKTATPMGRIAATTFSGYEGVLFERWNATVGQKWILPVTRQPCKIEYGQQYCPLCLSTEEPYFRRSWRLAFITICTKHRLQLLDRCATCASPISFHKAISNGRHAPPSDRMTFCYSCKADLRELLPESADSASTPNDEEVSFQVLLEEALRVRWISMPGGGLGYPLIYFPVLHKLMRLLAVGKIGTNLRESLSQDYGLKMFATSFRGKRPLLTQLAIGERRGLLGMARRLLANWPGDFIDFCKANRIPTRFLLSRYNQTPFWFW